MATVLKDNLSRRILAQDFIKISPFCLQVAPICDMLWMKDFVRLSTIFCIGICIRGVYICESKKEYNHAPV